MLLLCRKPEGNKSVENQFNRLTSKAKTSCKDPKLNKKLISLLWQSKTRGFLQIWCKHPLGMKDELLRSTVEVKRSRSLWPDGIAFSWYLRNTFGGFLQTCQKNIHLHSNWMNWLHFGVHGSKVNIKCPGQRQGSLLMNTTSHDICLRVCETFNHKAVILVLHFLRALVHPLLVSHKWRLGGGSCRHCCCTMVSWCYESCIISLGKCINSIMEVREPVQMWMKMAIMLCNTRLINKSFFISTFHSTAL